MNSHEFFKQVISRETSPFEFKIHLFQSESSRSYEGQPVNNRRDDRYEKLRLMDFLDEYKPLEIQTGYLNDNKKGGLSKLRLTFIINDKDKALELYTRMS